MPPRPPRLHSTRLACAGAGLVALASCSVFPDEAVLPAGSGGVAPSSGGATTSGGVSTTSGGRADGGQGGSNGGSSGAAGTPAGGSNSDGGMGGASGGATGASGADGGGAGGVTGDGGGGGSTVGGEGGSGGGAGGCSPTTLTLESIADAHIHEKNSDRTKNFGSAATLIVAGAPSNRSRATLDFDWSALPSDAQVVHAELQLILGARSGSADTTLVATRVATAWVEGEITWVQAAKSSNWVTPGGDVALLPSASLSIPANASAGLAVDFDVTRDVTRVQAGTEPAYGWMVLTDTADSNLEFGARESTFTDARPTLVVEICP